MTTKSYNCANQMGPGTDNTAFKSNGQMLLGPGTEAGNLSLGSGLSGTTSPGGFTLLQTGAFGFTNINFNSIPSPYVLVNNDSGLCADVTYYLPANPSAGDTYRILQCDIHTPINMGTVNQVAYINANSTSHGGQILGRSSSGADGLTIVCVFGGNSAVYVCYGVIGNFTLS